MTYIVKNKQGRQPYLFQHLDKYPRELTYSKLMIQGIGFDQGSTLTLRTINKLCSLTLGLGSEKPDTSEFLLDS